MRRIADMPKTRLLGTALQTVHGAVVRRRVQEMEGCEMKRIKYLDGENDICPRCFRRTIGHPEKRGVSDKRTCLCHSCLKRVGYIEYVTVDGSTKHKIYPIGGIHAPTKQKNLRLKKRHWNTTADEVTLALDAWRSR